MPGILKLILAALVVLALVVVVAFARRARASAAASGPETRMAACPHSPNCVSSDATDAEHAVAPLEISGDPDGAWVAIQRAVASLPRTTVVTVDDRYLHATAKTAVFGFVDDLELELRPADGIVAVRSASREGYSDLGVNRRRIEALREAWTAD